jgi:uncharacterized caspase-like protein
MIDAASICRQIHRSQAFFRLMIVDACRTEPRLRQAPEGKTLRGLDLLDGVPSSLIKEGTPFDISVLTSCSDGESASEDPKLEHGVFTHFFVTGLAGSADANDDGLVTLGEAFDYVRRETSSYMRQKHMRKQNPVANLDNIDSTSFVLGERAQAAKNRGARKQ